MLASEFCAVHQLLPPSSPRTQSVAMSEPSAIPPPDAAKPKTASFWLSLLSITIATFLAALDTVRVEMRSGHLWCY